MNQKTALLFALADQGEKLLVNNITNKECGYNIYGVCTCNEMKCVGEDCPYSNINQCPVHKEEPE